MFLKVLGCLWEVSAPDLLLSNQITEVKFSVIVYIMLFEEMMFSRSEDGTMF